MGSSKDPLAAVMSLIEFLGPCRFDGWADPDHDLVKARVLEPGDPIARDNPVAWVQIAAVSIVQTQNTMRLFPSLISPRLMKAYGLRKTDMGKEIIYAFGGRRQIQAVTSSPRALEGGRPTFVIKGETHHWLKANDGHGMADVIERNATKSKGGSARSLSITNAYEPGEDSVAQREREAYERQVAGLAIGTGMLYDSLEAPPGIKLHPGKQPDGSDPSEEQVKEHLAAIVRAVRGDAIWLDVDGIVSSILDRRNPPSRSRRFWLNVIVAAEDAWVDPAAARAAIDPLARDARVGEVDQLRCGWLVMPDDPIVVFGDGSKSDDATALVGCRLSDGYTFTLGVWQRPPGARGETWLAPRGEVRARVKEVMERFDVKAFWFDPSHTKDDEDGSRYWDGLLDEFHREYKDRLSVWAVKTGDRAHSVMWDMTSPDRHAQFVAGAEQFVEEIEHRDDRGELDPLFTHDGHPMLLQHMDNARRLGTSAGISLQKENRESRRKIDLAVCAVGARLLRRIVLNRGIEEQVEKAKAGTLWGG